MPDLARPCETHPDLVDFNCALPHLTESLERQRKTRSDDRIVVDSGCGQDSAVAVQTRDDSAAAVLWPDDRRHQPGNRRPGRSRGNVAVLCPPAREKLFASV